MNTEKKQKYLDYIEQNKNKFEKRKYFKIKDDLSFLMKEPSFILELIFIAIETDKTKELENIIQKEYKELYVSKDVKVRKLKLDDMEKIQKSFWRSLTNKNEHLLKLSILLLEKNEETFFNYMYKFSLISYDTNKLIKLYFFEKIYNKIGYDYELLKNLVNYFIKSQHNIISFEENNIDEITKNLEAKKDFLYEFIYVKNINNLINKYEIKNIQKLNFNIIDESRRKYLSEQKLILLNFLIEQEDF